MMGAAPRQFERGVFTISLDFELIWGTLDLPAHREFRALCAEERSDVVHRLLDLLAEFEISASWCTVGHLFLDHCSHNHPELVRSSSHDMTRLSRDPGTNEKIDPIFYGRDLIEKIRQCRVPQEIGSHSFTHVLFGETCSRETAESEIKAAVAAADDLGLTLKSFVFPRNQVGHVDLLHRYGFSSYRAQDETWYETVEKRRWFHRGGHLADILLATTPPAVMPRMDAAGVWAIPGSMLYTPSFGMRKFVPVKWRVARARKGLRAAVAQKRIFHLWFHPTDLVVRRAAMFEGLRQIFETAAEMRAKGALDVLSMGALSERLDSSMNEAPQMAQESV